MEATSMMTMNNELMRLLHRIAKLQKQAKPVNEKYITISAEVKKLAQIKSNSKIKYDDREGRPLPCVIPFGAFKLLKSNVTAPPLYYINKRKVTFSKSGNHDDTIVIKSKACSSTDVTVHVFNDKKKLIKWEITKQNAELEIFVNDNCLEQDELFILQNGDKILYNGGKKLNLEYEFADYSNTTFPTKLDALTFFKFKLKNLQESKDIINKQCEALRIQEENLKKKMKKERASRKRNKETNDKKKKEENMTKVKREKEEFESSKKIKLEGMKNIGAKLINSVTVVKREKVEASEAKIKTESAEVIEID